MALAQFDAPGAGERLIEEIDERMREAAEAEHFERAAALLRRRDRLAWVLERLDGVLRATHTAPRLVLAQHPAKERFDAFWIVQGRLLDWGPLPGASELVERTEAALSRPPGRAPIPAAEIDEVRIVASWIAEHEPPTLTLDPKPAHDALLRFAGASAPESAAA
jgi:excinuclease UvrABC nuclease subunit